MEANAVGFFLVGFAIEREEAGGFDFLEEFLVFAGRERKIGADFGVGGGTAEPFFQSADGFAKVFRLVAQRARNPVHPAQFIVHGAADVQGGERTEGGSLGGIEFPRRGHQSDDADAVEIVQVNDRGQIKAHAIHGRFDERQMLFDEQVFVAGGVVRAGRGADREKSGDR
jgi:hypothetical protein